MTKRNAALIVEMFLRMWEDVCFLEHASAISHGQTSDPVLANAPLFRDYLLNFRPGNRFAEERFIATDTDTVVGVMAAAPALIASWIAGSKRIFRISAEMQTRFANIKFGNLRLSDIRLPLPVFGVQLETPIKEDVIGYGFMFLWMLNKPDDMTRLTDRHHLSVIALPETTINYGGLDPDECQRVLRDMQSPKWSRRGFKRAAEMVKKQKKMAQQSPRVGFISLPLDELYADMSIEEYFAHMLETDKTVLDTDIQQIRIAFNLCLYLQSLPPGAEQEEGVEWKTEYLPKKDLKTILPVIVKRTEVCDIVGHHIIDGMVVDKRSADAKAHGWEMEPMWRRAHSRRPPGKGNDPAAEKSVEVRHYLIREDRAVQGRPIRGALAEVR